MAIGLDAGNRLGESVERNMIAVRIGLPLRTVVIATAAFRSAHGRPAYPRDLLHYPYIGYPNPRERHTNAVGVREG